MHQPPFCQATDQALSRWHEWPLVQQAVCNPGHTGTRLEQFHSQPQRPSGGKVVALCAILTTAADPVYAVSTEKVSHTHSPKKGPFLGGGDVSLCARSNHCKSSKYSSRKPVSHCVLCPYSPTKGHQYT